MAAIAKSFLTSCDSCVVASICKLTRSGRLLSAMDVSGPIVANVLILSVYSPWSHATAFRRALNKRKMLVDDDL